MSIGSTIKRLRREKDITQEELAEYLGITSRAVSQWECGRTAPDLSQLPALCHIFDVTSDELLGIDAGKNEEAIRMALEKARAEMYQGNFEGCAEILREANRRFPRSCPIMQELANALVNVYSRTGVKDYEEVFSLCGRVLAECTDSKVRFEAAQTLGIAYGYAGKTEEMRRIADEMPRAHQTFEQFMMYKWKGDEDFPKVQAYLSFLIYQTVCMLHRTAVQRHDDGTLIYPMEDRIRLWKLQVELLELLFPDGDFQFKAQLGEIACDNLCMAHYRRGEYEEAWHWLEKGADFAIHMDTYDPDAPHTSVVLRGYSDGGWIMEAEGSRSHAMLSWLTNDEEAAAFRADARCEMLVARLRAAARS